jgi:uncharacterized protein YndB with AHSA1/START domain
MTDLVTPTRSLVIEREMPHPPQKIWRALTQAALIEQWLMKNDFEPVVGHRFNFRAAPIHGWNGVTDCEVLEIIRGMGGGWPRILGKLEEIASRS